MTSSRYHLPNPKKIKMDRMKKFTGYMPDEIFIGATDGTLPPGARAKDLLPKNEVKITVPLRKDQMDIFQKLKNKTSVLFEAKTGSGKTVLACALCEYWMGKTLIVVHSRDMVKQFGDEIKKFLGEEVGEYYTSKKELKKITITTTKSFIRHYDKMVEFGFRNLIRDEADLEFTEPQRNAITKFPAIQKVGMTGTIRTEFDDYIDGSPALCRFYGVHVKLLSDDSDTPLKGVLYKTYTKKYEDENKIPYSPQNDWQGFRTHMDKDVDRKRQMMKYILDNASPQDHVLILFDRVWDVEFFSYCFKKERPEWNVGMIHGTVNKKLREKRIASFKRDGGLLFSQEKVAGRGFNVVKINKCFILFPCKSETNLRQIIGRAIRPFLDKNSFIYTWVDSQLYFQHKARIRTIDSFFPDVPVKEI